MADARFETISRHLPNPSKENGEIKARAAALDREAGLNRANDELASRLPHPHTSSYPRPGEIAHSPYDRIVKP